MQTRIQEVPPLAVAAARAKRLMQVTKGKQDEPIWVLIYGVPKVGKSTFGANAPKPIFLGAESGTAELDVTRLPAIESWADALDSIDELTNDPHDYKTLVIDSLDWLEPYVTRAVLQEAGVKALADMKWGAGYAAVLDKWRELLKKLELMSIKRQMHIVLVAHPHIKQVTEPGEETFDKYVLKMNDKSAGLIIEWCKAVLFAKHESFVVAREGGDKNAKKSNKATGDGVRIVHTESRPAWVAGNRYSLPQTIPLDWDEFYALTRKHTVNVDKLREGILAVIESMTDPEMKTKASAAYTALADNVPKLERFLEFAKAKVSQ